MNSTKSLLKGSGYASSSLKDFYQINKLSSYIDINMHRLTCEKKNL
jgi:hypothetical protein